MTKDVLTLDRLKQIIRDRGGQIVVLPDGTPVLRGLGVEATPALLRVVGYFREELLAELKGAEVSKSLT